VTDFISGSLDMIGKLCGLCHLKIQAELSIGCIEAFQHLSMHPSYIDLRLRPFVAGQAHENFDFESLGQVLVPCVLAHAE